MADSRVGTAVLVLRTDNVPLNEGLKDAEKQAERTKERFEKSGATLSSFGGQIRSAAQTLAGLSAIMSIAVRDNEVWRDRLEKVTVALSAGAVGLNFLRNIARLAKVDLDALQATLLAGSRAAGIYAAALAGLVAVLHGLNAVTNYSEKGGKRLAQVMAERAGVTEALVRADAAASRFTSTGQGLIHRQRELQSQLEDTTGAQERARISQEQLTAAREKEAKALAEQARRERERREAIEGETNDLLLQDEAMRETEEQTRRLDDETKNLVFDARDYARVAREDAAAQEVFNQWIRDTIPSLIQEGQALEGVQGEAARAAGSLGQFNQQNADAADLVVQTTFALEALAGKFVMTAEEGIEVSEDLARIGGVEAAIVYLQSWRDGLEAVGQLTDEAAERINTKIAELFGRLDKIKSKTFDLGKAIKDVFADAFTDGMRNLENFGDALNSLINSLLNALTRHVGEGAFQFLFPTKKEHGGPFSAFQPLLVGEVGPELAMFPRSGTIVPHHEFASAMGGGGPMIVNVDARGAAPGVGVEVRRALAEMGEQAVRASVAAVQDEFSRGGSFRSRMRR